MLTPRTDLMRSAPGSKILLRMDVPSIAGGVNVAGSLAQESRPLVINFLKGYMEAIHYLKTNKAGSLKVFAKHLRSSDARTVAALSDELAGPPRRQGLPVGWRLCRTTDRRSFPSQLPRIIPKAERLWESDTGT